MSGSPPFEPTAWVADTGLFVACGRQQNDKYRALERFARRNEITFRIPARVYAELGGAPDRSTPGRTPVDSAIDSGWVAVADEPEYANPVVSTVMDDVRRYIARASNRDEDDVEMADAALAGTAVELLDSGRAAFVSLVTTDVDAGEGTVSAVEANGFEGRIAFENGFDLIEEIT